MGVIPVPEAFSVSARQRFPSTRVECRCSAAGGNGGDALLNPGAENGVTNESRLVKAMTSDLPLQFNSRKECYESITD